MGNRNFTDTMEQGKALAIQNRNRGIATGKSAKGWTRKRRDTDEGWARDKIVMRLKWIEARDWATEGYLRDVFPERYEAFQ